MSILFEAWESWLVLMGTKGLYFPKVKFFDNLNGVSWEDIPF